MYVYLRVYPSLPAFSFLSASRWVPAISGGSMIESIILLFVAQELQVVGVDEVVTFKVASTTAEL